LAFFVFFFFFFVLITLLICNSFCSRFCFYIPILIPRRSRLVSETPFLSSLKLSHSGPNPATANAKDSFPNSSPASATNAQPTASHPNPNNTNHVHFASLDPSPALLPQQSALNSFQRQSVCHSRSAQHRASWHLSQLSSNEKGLLRPLALRDDGGSYTIDLEMIVPSRNVKETRDENEKDAENRAESHPAGSERIESEIHANSNDQPLLISATNQQLSSTQSLSPRVNPAPQPDAVSPNISPLSSNGVEAADFSSNNNSPTNLSPTTDANESDQFAVFPPQPSPLGERQSRLVKREHIRNLSSLFREAIEDEGESEESERAVSEIEASLRNIDLVSTLLDEEGETERDSPNLPPVWSMDRSSIQFDQIKSFPFEYADEKGITMTANPNVNVAIVLASPRASFSEHTRALSSLAFVPAPRIERKGKRVGGGDSGERGEQITGSAHVQFVVASEQQQQPTASSLTTNNNPRDVSAVVSKSRSALATLESPRGVKSGELMTSPRLDRGRANNVAREGSGSEDSLGRKAKARSAPQFKWKRKSLIPRDASALHATAVDASREEFLSEEQLQQLQEWEIALEVVESRCDAMEPIVELQQLFKQSDECNIPHAQPASPSFQQPSQQVPRGEWPRRSGKEERAERRVAGKAGTFELPMLREFEELYAHDLLFYIIIFYFLFSIFFYFLFFFLFF
jgi:hypothetical protein